jgi:hypothetical protein
MFRDESDEVARKAQTKEIKKLHTEKRAIPHRGKGKSPASVSATSSDESSPDPDSPPPDVVDGIVMFQTPSPNVDDLATCLFLRNYVVSASGFSSGIMDHLPSIHSQAQHHGVLSVTISAVGLALMSNINRAPEIMAVAREKYATALKMTNTALQHSTESKADPTLMAVMLLGMFEVRLSQSCL